MFLKHKSIFRGALAAAIFSSALTFPSYANLLITPLQVVMEDRDRATEIILVNNSRDTNTYRIHWEQLYQTEGAGGYLRASDEEREERFDLEDFAVFTPRQITLRPSQKQTIRIALRKPADLADGEYKSHLKFSIAPELSRKANTLAKPGANEISVGAQVFASYSIPVAYRKGDYDINIDIGQPQFSTNPKTGFIIMNVPVTRTGTHGTIGFIEVFYKPDGGEEVLIASLGNANIFSEINTRNFQISTQKTGLNPGHIRVSFKETKGEINNHTVLAEKTFSIGR